MKGPVHIIGASCISPQDTFDRDGIASVKGYDGHPLHAIAPDLRRYIDPVRGRRMARVSRFGMATALNALERAGVRDPGGIIVGTGLGCMESTERFLDTMIANAEMMVNPTAFIQSTHNAVAGQIALALGSRACNFTYLHKGLSFPSALFDAFVQVRDEGNERVLAGGVDIITDDHFAIQRRSGLLKEEGVGNLGVLEHGGPGAVCGEGAAFFVLDGRPGQGTDVRLVEVDIHYAPDLPDAAAHVRSILQRHMLEPDAIDLVVVGPNGDAMDDPAYGPVMELFPTATVTAFKPLCGEFYTANAFGTWYAWSSLVQGRVHPEVLLRGEAQRPFRRALFYDRFRGCDHSVVIMER
ncbi:MAG: beta-ketoacyl synthase chain length factor [Flavobacteriales bacterium]|nr:beta-ketoacyl synthase chain length factor [Flavobacteriales bacterium]MCB9168452.1 beta-ketoacyl synthase chain length factor [Flavobacteriales bacterium]